MENPITAEDIKTFRRDNSISIEEMANMMGFSKTHIYHVEEEKRPISKRFLKSFEKVVSKKAAEGKQEYLKIDSGLYQIIKKVHDAEPNDSKKKDRYKKILQETMDLFFQIVQMEIQEYSPTKDLSQLLHTYRKKCADIDKEYRSERTK